MKVRRSNFKEVVERLSQPGEYGLDCETTGLRHHDRLFSIILADSQSPYYFNFWEYVGLEEDLLLPRNYLSSLQPILQNPNSTFYISNAKFDLAMLRKEGLEVLGKVICTNAIGRIERNNHLQGYSLEKSAERIGLKKDDKAMEYLQKHKLYSKENIPGKKSEFKNMRFQDVPYEIMSEYAQIDAKLHLAVGQHLIKSIAKESSVGAPSLWRVTDNEIELTKVCFEMEWLGIKINRAYVEGALEYEQALLSRAKQEFRSIASEDFIDSNKQFERIFTAQGSQFPRTAKGNPSFTDAVLSELDSPLAKAIQTIRHHEKRAGTYYSSFLFFADSNDVLRPNMRQGGTETGRFSYSDPNLQNVPKEDGELDKEKTYVVRGSFVPREDFCFVMIDYSQQEFRLMLDYAGEKTLIEEINAGADVHTATAKLLGIPRKFAKTINFGLLYGMGSEKLAKALGISVPEARGYKDLYFARLPRVEHFISQVSRRGKARGFIWNWAGRRCHIDNPQYAYILPNHLVQGGCGDIVKFAMTRIAKFLQGKKSRMLLQIHDELLFEIHRSELDIISQLKEIMENIYAPRNGMQMAVEISHSWNSWGNPDVKKGPPEDAP